MGLFAAQITAQTGNDPGRYYDVETRDLGKSYYQRIDAPASQVLKTRLANVTVEQFDSKELAGDAITAKLTRAPRNNQPINGIKVISENGCFAAPPSRTEDIYKIYAESFCSEDHLKLLQRDAQASIDGLQTRCRSEALHQSIPIGFRAQQIITTMSPNQVDGVEMSSIALAISESCFDLT